MTKKSNDKTPQAQGDQKKVDANQFKADEVSDQPPSAASDDESNPSSNDGHNALRKRLQDMEVELQDKHNQVLYHMAECKNIRERAGRDVENAHRYGTENLLKKLLPVLDSLERGMVVEQASKDPMVKALSEGMALTQKMFLEVLEGFNVSQVDPIGKPFDSEHHEAISMKEDKSVQEKTVVEVMQKGYTLNGRLVRPALVVVAK